MPGLTEPNQVGKREDLADLISMVDAKDTPLASMIPKGAKLTASLFSWQADAYDKPNQDGVVDGTDVSTFNNKAKNRAKLDGRVQWVREPWMVSKLSQDLSDVAGVKSEKARAIAHCLTEMKRSIEAIIGSDAESQADDGTKPYKTRGLGSWISSSAQTDLPVDANFRTPSGSIDSTAMASLTETIVGNVLESIYSETGQLRSYSLPCGTALKRAFTGLSLYVPDKASHLAVRRMNQSNPQMIEHSISVYEGDFGTLNLLPSLFLANGTSNAPTRRGYILNMDLLQLRYKRRPRFKELEDKGGGRRGIVDAIFALVVTNPLGLGKFAATS